MLCAARSFSKKAMHVRYEGWLLDIDVERTRAAYESISQSDPAACGCEYCSLWEEVREDVYTPEFRTFLDKAGVHFKREADATAWDDGPGELLYFIFFHAFGRILETPREPPFGPETDFSVGFRADNWRSFPLFEEEEEVLAIDVFARVYTCPEAARRPLWLKRALRRLESLSGQLRLYVESQRR